MSHRFSLGIDLGTSNSAIALTDLESDRTELVEVTPKAVRVRKRYLTESDRKQSKKG